MPEEERDPILERILLRKLKSLMEQSMRKEEVSKERIIHVRSLKELKALLNKATGERKPVIVDFWAPWCGPCLALAPVFEQVAREFGDRAYFVKVNVDEATEIAFEFGIMSIPTLIAFVNGEPADIRIGYMPAKVLTKWIGGLIKRALNES